MGKVAKQEQGNGPKLGVKIITFRLRVSALTKKEGSNALSGRPKKRGSYIGVLNSEVDFSRNRLMTSSTHANIPRLQPVVSKSLVQAAKSID